MGVFGAVARLACLARWMRPGGSSTTRIEPSGSTLAPATAGR